MEEVPEEESPWQRVGYYEILGLETSATPEEIKKAYRKRAMQCHPDKGGDAEEFKRVGEAKAVLSDPEARNFYDMYGEDGVTFHKGGKEAKPNEMLAQMGVGGIICFCCTNVTCVVFMLLFPLLLCIKVTSREEWLWGLIFTPLWVVDTIVIIMLCIWPLLPVNVAKGDPLSNCKFDWLAQALLFVLFQVLLCVRLDGSDLSWGVIFTPLYLFQLISTGRAIYKITPSQYAHYQRVRKPGSTCGNVVWGLYLLMQELLWWALWVLLSLRLGGDLELSYWAVLSPAFVLYIFWFYAAMRTAVVIIVDQDEKAYEQAFSRWKFAGTLLLLLVTVLAAFVGEGTEGFSIWVIWAPIYTVCGCFICAVVTTSCALAKKEGEGVTVDFNDTGSDGGFTPRDTDPLHPEHSASHDHV